LINNLCDKSPQKRRLAVKEIEKIIKAMIEQKNDKRIRLIIAKFDKTFIKTINNDPSLKKGGLRGLAAVTIGISIDE